MNLYPHGTDKSRLTPVKYGEDLQSGRLPVTQLGPCRHGEHIVGASLQVTDTEVAGIGSQPVLFYGEGVPFVPVVVAHHVANDDTIRFAGRAPHNSHCGVGYVREVHAAGGAWYCEGGIKIFKISFFSFKI